MDENLFDEFDKVVTDRRARFAGVTSFMRGQASWHPIWETIGRGMVSPSESAVISLCELGDRQYSNRGEGPIFTMPPEMMG